MSENYIIDIEDVTLTGMEVRDRDDWGIHIYEGEGSFTDKFQSMDFTTNGFDISVSFDLTVSGWFERSGGGYMEQEEERLHITDVDVDVTNFLINDSDVLLNIETSRVLENIIKKQING